MLNTPYISGENNFCWKEGQKAEASKSFPDNTESKERIGRTLAPYLRPTFYGISSSKTQPWFLFGLRTPTVSYLVQNVQNIVFNTLQKLSSTTENERVCVCLCKVYNYSILDMGYVHSFRQFDIIKFRLPPKFILPYKY